MRNKKRAKKGIEALKDQIELHKEKERKAREGGNIGLVNYYEKEIEHFEQAMNRLKKQAMPKKKKVK